MVVLQVAREFGFEENFGIDLLRCAESLMTSAADKSVVKEISLYRKFNRMRDGNISVGDVAPTLHAPLIQMKRNHSPNATSVYGRDQFAYSSLDLNGLFRQSARPVVVLASSYS